MRLIDADELTRRIEQSYLTKGEKKLFSVKVRHMPTFDLDESVIQEVLNKMCMTAITNEYLIELITSNGKRSKGEWKVKTLSTFPQYQPDEYECPFCKTIVTYKTNYCPNCGADMRKGGAE